MLPSRFNALLHVVSTGRHGRTAASFLRPVRRASAGFIDICQRFLRRSEAAVRVVDYAAQFVEELNKSASRRVHPIGSDLRVCGWCGFGVQSKFSVMFGGVTTYP